MQIIRSQELEYVPASHEDPQQPGVLKKVLATKEHLMAGRVQMLNWSHLPQGSSFQPHFHQDMQEVFVLLNGRVEMTVNDQSFELAGGDAILVEANEIHQMTNCSDGPVDYIVFGISSEQGGQTIVVESP